MIAQWADAATADGAVEANYCADVWCVSVHFGGMAFLMIASLFDFVLVRCFVMLL